MITLSSMLPIVCAFVLTIFLFLLALIREHLRHKENSFKPLQQPVHAHFLNTEQFMLSVLIFGATCLIGFILSLISLLLHRLIPAKHIITTIAIGFVVFSMPILHQSYRKALHHFSLKHLNQHAFLSKLFSKLAMLSTCLPLMLILFLYGKSQIISLLGVTLIFALTSTILTFFWVELINTLPTRLLDHHNNIKKASLLIGCLICLWMLQHTIDSAWVLFAASVLLIVIAVTLGALRPANAIFQKLRRMMAIFIFVYGLILLIGAVSGNTNPLKPLYSKHLAHLIDSSLE